jgi:K+-sensing histidine kinase KdpD
MFSSTSQFGQYAAAIAIAVMAALVAEDLPANFFWLKCAAFAAAVCWSFLRLRLGPAFLTLVAATLTTDYFVIEPVYSISFDAWTALTLTCYFALGLLVLKLGTSRRENHL